MTFHDSSITFKIRKNYKDELKRIAQSDKKLFENTAHVVRIACIKFIREYGGKKDE